MRLSSRLKKRLRKILPLKLQWQLYTIWRMAEAFYRRPKGYQNFLLNSLSQQLGVTKAYGNPVSITIEPTNVCNLNCPICETGSHILGRRPHMMNYEEFVQILEKVGPGANHIMFYYMGETFLNREVYQMIRYARDMGLYVMTCTNGDVVDPEKLYESGINLVSFQIAGITQETHKIYRVNSDLNRVLENVRRYIDIIHRRGRRPGEHQVELGFIVMRHNEGEIGEFIEMAETLGVDRKNIISPCVRTPEQGKQFLPNSSEYWIYDRERFKKDGILIPKRITPKWSCPWLYYSITIQVDGNVVPCCRDPHGRYVLGNLLNQSLEEIWNGPKFRKFRKDISNRNKELDLCKLCPGEGIAPLF